MDPIPPSISLVGNASPWSAYSLQVTAPEHKYQGGDGVADGPDHTGPPLPRCYHSSSMISSPSGDVFIFGGMSDTGHLNDTWKISLSGNSSSPIGSEGDPRVREVKARLLEITGEAPVSRSGHQSVLVNGILVMWGGQTPVDGIGFDFKFSDDCIHFLDTAARDWTKLDIQPAPPGRFWHAACVCGNKFIVFGGLATVTGQLANDIWAFNLDSLWGTPEWKRIDIAPGSQSPPGRAGHAMIAYGEVLYIFGGEAGTTTFNDTWSFDMSTRVWTKLRCTTPMPPPRAYHAVTLVDNAVYIFGGCGEDSKPLGDTWCFKLNEQRWYELPDVGSKPEAAKGHILATINNQVFLFGGEHSDKDMTRDLRTVHILDTSLLIYPEHGEETASHYSPRIKQPHSTRLTNISEAVRHARERLPRSSSALGSDLASGSLKGTDVKTGTDYMNMIKLARAMDDIRSDTLQANLEEGNLQLNQETAVLTAGDTITGAMSATEILRYLVLHGCRDISEDLYKAQITEYPISSGGFGDVYFATLRNGDTVGLKSLRILIDSTDEGKRYLKRAAHELYVWSKCKHPNVLELSGVTIFRGKIAMVSPWANNGQLRWFLSRNPQVDRRALCTQIAEGVEYLHEQGIVHGDLKPENVLITSDYTPKLTDFGNAALAEYTLQFTSSSTTQSMSVRWTAPEILKQETKTTQSGDIFALGMIIFEIVTGLLPYAGSSDPVVMFSIAAGKLPERPQAHIPSGGEQSDRLWSIINRCWAYNPDERPNAHEVKEMLSGTLSGGLLASPARS